MTSNARTETFAKLPRRQFMSVIAIGASGMVASANTRRELSLNKLAAETDLGGPAVMQVTFGQISSETVLLPTPTEALADLLNDINRSHIGVLQEYYAVIAIFATESSNRYAKLKEAARDLQVLVPQLKSNAKVTRIRDFAEIGLTGTRMLQVSSKTSSASATNVSLINISAQNLSDLGYNLNQSQETLSLTGPALEKLRQMLKMIEELDSPQANLTLALNALNNAMKVLGPKVEKIEGSVISALKSLAEAERLEFELFHRKQRGGLVTEPVIIADRSEVQGIKKLRDKAVGELKDAATEMRGLEATSLPADIKSAARAIKPDLNTSTSVNGAPPSPDMIADLVAGCAKWIAKRYELSARVDNEGEVTIIPAVHMQVEAWTRLWGDISEVLAKNLPQASTPRIRKLYWRKWCMSFYSQSRQEAILYNLLPDLPQVREHNLIDKANDALRKRVAELLSRL